jgi:hypothetical protein
VDTIARLVAALLHMLVPPHPQPTHNRREHAKPWELRRPYDSWRQLPHQLHLFHSQKSLQHLPLSSDLVEDPRFRWEQEQLLGWVWAQDSSTLTTLFYSVYVVVGSEIVHLNSLEGKKLSQRCLLGLIHALCCCVPTKPTIRWG